MSLAIERRKTEIQEQVAKFCLVWLTLANAIGVWLAVLLVWPQVGTLFGRFGYGRWMPLHMDWQLYGWCAMPLLGLLCLRVLKFDRKGYRNTGIIFWLWSVALLVGGGTWLAGSVTGKPFLNWTGFSRTFFAVSLLAIWVVLQFSWLNRLKQKRKDQDVLLDGILLLGLFFVPVSLYLVSDATVYPPVNPNSGGATGHSLLASTLGIVAIMGLLPHWGLNIEIKRKRSHVGLYFWLLFGASVVLYLLIQHGNARNSSLDQIVGLGSLMIWPVGVFYLWRNYRWSDATKGWRIAFFFWWGFLALSGWLTFLPGVLTVVKFTNAMVAHAHLAMAGMVTALNMLILIEMGNSYSVRKVLESRNLIWVWNLGLLGFVLVLVVQGVREGNEPGDLYLFDNGTRAIYILRLIAGIALLVCSGKWIQNLWIRAR